MTLPCLGVVIVTFNSADVILDCIESLLAAEGVQLTITIVDNGSTDATLPLLRKWADGLVPEPLSADIPFALAPSPKPIPLWHPNTPLPTCVSDHRIVLIETGINAGFAAGVNHGLAYLAKQVWLDRFWVLNPDIVVPPQTPLAFASAIPTSGFSLMGGRVIYLDMPDAIQIDGGTINFLTGVTGNINVGASHLATPAADPDKFDFITGASLVVSRVFYEKVGPLCEDYFLYYEEVDWAMRRGNMPLAYCAEAIIYHRAGTAIGSATLKRPASAFSIYFKHRSRIIFIRKFNARSLPIVLLWSLMKAIQLFLKGYKEEAKAVLSAVLNMPPPPSVQKAILLNKVVLPK